MPVALVPFKSWGPIAQAVSGFTRPVVPRLAEGSTGALEQTHRFAAALAAKGIRHELDVWGEDTPHDWPAWRAQIAHHLPRFA